MYGYEHHEETLSYQDVEQAGPAVEPLDFPTPRVHRAAFSTATVLDHRDYSHEVKNVLVRIPENPREERPNRAYHVKKKISKTTYGSVRLCVVLRRNEKYRPGKEEEQAEWIRTGQVVVVKVSSWAKIRQCRGKHLEDPLKESACLQHVGNYQPNVLGCVEVLQDNDHLYTIMRYCSGGDLYSRISQQQKEKGSSPRSREQEPHAAREDKEAQARLWFRQLLQALLHLQKKGVAHRDLSLENLLVDANNNLVVVDFGLSLRVPFTDMSNYGGVSDVSEGTTRRLMKPQGQSGSLTYLAPEIIERDEAFDGFATDLWSAGVILFVFLVGLAPFKWPHPTDYRYAQINKGKLRELMKKLNKPVSDEATDLLQNMLWRDPRKRLCLAQVLTHPWVVGPPEKRGSSTTPQVVGTTENSSPTNRALPRIVSEELVGKSTPKHHPMARHTTTRLAF